MVTRRGVVVDAATVAPAGFFVLFDGRVPTQGAVGDGHRGAAESAAVVKDGAAVAGVVVEIAGAGDRVAAQSAVVDGQRCVA